MIHSLYDEVSFIEQSTYNNKPLLKIYFDSDDTAANIESWFDEKISRDIDEYTSGNIVVCPSWIFEWDWRKKNADVFIETELLKYDNLGNVVNESVLKEETSIKDKTRDLVTKYGFSVVKDMYNDDDKFYDIIDLDGSQDDMSFVANAIMKHEVKAKLCWYTIEKTKHSIRIYFEVPKYFPDKDKNYWPNRKHVLDLDSFIRDRIYNLGKGTVRGHRVYGGIGDC
jgi:hypothetical protein